MKQFKLLMGFVAIATILNVSCAKKDTSPDLTTKIVGTFIGDRIIGVESPDTMSNAKIVVTKVDNSTVTFDCYINQTDLDISFKGTIKPGTDMQDIVIPNQTISGITVSGSGYIILSTPALLNLEYFTELSGVGVVDTIHYDMMIKQ